VKHPQHKKNERKREMLSPAGMIWGYAGTESEAILKKPLLLARGVTNGCSEFLFQI